MIAVAVLVWACLALVAWSYLAYPFVVFALARGAKPPAPGREAGKPLPRAAVIVAAYNEERDIGERIANLLGQDYPADRLAILVGSDGSRDRTVEIAKSFTDPRVKVHAFEVNRGKASVLNDLAAAAAMEAEVLVFTDANTHFRPDTVRRLVESLDERTAAACGELLLVKPGAGSNQDHAYWSVERRLKRAESALGGLLGANGGVYAIRRDAWRPIAPDTICDDFVIAMRIAAAGEGLRYVPEAVATEETPGDMSEEYHRRVRIGIGNYQSLFRHPEFLTRSSWALRFTYVSHKVLRWLTPHLALVAFAGCLALAAEPLYRGLAILMAAGAAFAGLVYATRESLPWPGAVKGASFLAMLNLAFLVGFWRFLNGNYRGSWRRTQR